MATICFPFVGNHVGGSHLSALGLISHLDRRRFEPVVLVQDRNGPVATLFGEAGIASEEAPASARLAHGKRLRIADMIRLAGDVGPLSRSLSNRRVDIVHTNDGRTHATWALASRLAGAALVWHHRGSADAMGLRYLAPLVADEVISVSAYALSRRALWRSSSQRTVIHSPFDTNTDHDRRNSRQELLTELGCCPTTKFVAFSGAFIPRKRPNLFIEVIAALRRIRPELKVRGLLFGEALEIKPETLLARAAALGVADTIHLMGYRTPGPHWIAGCDALLIPAIDEPFGRTLIEAMLVGTPVIATRCGGNVEALREGTLGILVPPEDPDAMAVALAELFDRPAWQRDLCMLAQSDARSRFGDRQHAEQVMAVYDKLLNRRARTSPAG